MSSEAPLDFAKWVQDPKAQALLFNSENDLKLPSPLKETESPGKACTKEELIAAFGLDNSDEEEFEFEDEEKKHRLKKAAMESPEEKPAKKKKKKMNGKVVVKPVALR